VMLIFVLSMCSDSSIHNGWHKVDDSRNTTRCPFLSLLICGFGALALLQALTSFEGGDSREVTAQVIFLLDLIDTDLKERRRRDQRGVNATWHEYLRSSFQK
jgi:hypothetical protein